MQEETHSNIRIINQTGLGGVGGIQEISKLNNSYLNGSTTRKEMEASMLEQILIHYNLNIN